MNWQLHVVVPTRLLSVTAVSDKADSPQPGWLADHYWQIQ